MVGLRAALVLFGFGWLGLRRRAMSRWGAATCYWSADQHWTLLGKEGLRRWRIVQRDLVCSPELGGQCIASQARRRTCQGITRL